MSHKTFNVSSSYATRNDRPKKVGSCDVRTQLEVAHHVVVLSHQLDYKHGGLPKF
jgi:hypothetical protein